MTLINTLKKQNKGLFLFVLLFSFGNVIYGQVNLTNGLVAHYPFNGNANDVAGNNRNGQLMNGPALTTDRFGNANSAYHFDGNNDYIRIVDDGAFSSPNFSLVLWFQSDTDNLQNLVGKRDFTGSNNGAQYQFFINYSPFPGIGSNIVGNTSNCSNIASSSYTNTGDVICKTKWYFAVVTLETTGAGVRHRIYIDGVLKRDVAASFTGMLTTCQSELRFGNWWSGDLIPFRGKMDDIRWYNRALNQAEVTALYDNFPTSSSADFNFSQSPCSPRTIQFSNVTPNTSSISWDFGNNTSLSNNQNPTVTYNAFGNYTVKLKVQTTSGCIDSVSKVIPVTVIQDSMITTADTAICRGASVQLKTQTALNFCWGTTVGLNNSNIANPIATPANTTVYHFTSQVPGTNLVTNGDFSAGNSGFQSDYTQQTPPNTTEAVYWISTNSSAWNSNFNSCGDHTSGSGNMMMVNGSALNGAKVWSQTINVTPNTNYAFSVWIQSLAALNPARLRFSINNYLLGNNINAGSTACQWSQFFATWNSGSTTSAIITIVNNNTVAAGNDFAIDDISFSPVIIKHDSVTVTVTDPPPLTISSSGTVCKGDTVALNVSGAGNYSWSPNTTLINSNTATPSAFPSVTTKYYVNGYDVAGCTSKDSVTIIVKDKPQITKSDDVSVCTGFSPVQLSANAAGALQYTWSPAAGLSNASITNPLANPSGTTTYYVEVLGSNACKATDSIKVSVFESPSVDTRSDTTICNGIETVLHTITSDATTFNWYPTTGLSNPNIANPLASPTVLTKYIITASNAACSVKDSVTIDVLPAPAVTRSKDTTICDQGSAQLFATGGNVYSWSPATGLSNASIANPIASPTAPTKYKVLVTGINGCSKLDSVEVNWIPQPAFSITPATPSVCSGNSITLTASGADVYNWFSGSNIQSATTAATSITPPFTQPYKVAVHHNFCKISDTLETIITVNSLPTIAITKSNDIDCSNASATLNATGGNSFSWTPTRNIAAANSASPVVSPAETTTYVVTVTNSDGCTNKDSIQVNALFNPLSGGYNMPDAFTPNNDGKNDCFGIKYWGAIEKLEFIVYNRWGEAVFRTSNPSACWDGNYKGVPQSSGTFVYQIRAKTACGEVYKKGTVLLMR